MSNNQKHLDVKISFFYIEFYRNSKWTRTQSNDNWSMMWSRNEDIQPPTNSTNTTLSECNGLL